MDRDIYFQTNAEMGIYAARRHPKGSGINSDAGGAGGGASAPVANAGGTGGAVSSDTPSGVNPLPVLLDFHNSLASHAATSRNVYTVPPKRKAKLQAATACVQRTIAAAAVGQAFFVIRVFRNGAINAAELVRAQIFNNAVGAQDNMVHTGEVELFEGDRVEIITGDGSGAGGAVGYDGSAAMVEYDSVFNNPVVAAADPRFSAPQPQTLSYQGFSSGPVNYTTTPGGSWYLGTVWRMPNGQLWQGPQSGISWDRSFTPASYGA